tara:strand:+ start:346 stop:609 length:264 start_codon:yes stop_codon:yes gene_type:complete
MNFSNRQIEMLYDQWNPNSVMVGDRVIVNLTSNIYQARIVGLNLDIKNKKVYANLRLMDTSQRLPIKVDVADCHKVKAAYPGHHKNG